MPARLLMLLSLPYAPAAMSYADICRYASAMFAAMLLEC